MHRRLRLATSGDRDTVAIDKAPVFRNGNGIPCELVCMGLVELDGDPIIALQTRIAHLTQCLGRFQADLKIDGRRVSQFKNSQHRIHHV